MPIATAPDGQTPSLTPDTFQGHFGGLLGMIGIESNLGLVPIAGQLSLPN
jgi:hypothetical protein